MSLRTKLFFFLFLCLASGGCTRNSEIKSGDCLVETGENPDTFLVTNVSEGLVFGHKYINTEQGNETIEIDMTEGYKKVACPDMKDPPPPIE